MSLVGNHTIEQAIYELFTAPGRRFAKVDLGSFPDSVCPGLNVSVVSGQFSLDTIDDIRQDLEIILLVAVKNIRSEMERRRLAHPLVEYVVQQLNGTDLGLDINLIRPTGWTERTTNEHFKLGEMVFEVRFTTASRIPVTPISDQVDSDLESIFAEYQVLQTTSQTVELVLDQTGGAA